MLRILLKRSPDGTTGEEYLMSLGHDIGHNPAGKQPRLKMIWFSYLDALRDMWFDRTKSIQVTCLVLLCIFSIGLLPVSSILFEVAIFNVFSYLITRRTLQSLLRFELVRLELISLAMYLSYAVSQWLFFGGPQTSSIPIYLLVIPSVVLGLSLLCLSGFTVRDRIPADDRQVRVVLSASVLHILAAIEIARVQLVANNGPLSIAHEVLSNLKSTFEIGGVFVAAYGLFEISRLASATRDRSGN
ncbi:hypothetical protein [Rhodoluna sp.]|uniref:hypothetical protein n=1 Tax=Rhodoluna sp. TaxID=1969481 RepID=UPI0025F6D86F|nr:hypothetical protein [Rhodoluna sp.]